MLDSNLSVTFVCFMYIWYRMIKNNLDTHTNICINIKTDEFETAKQ
jgi:hypothetical protein